MLAYADVQADAKRPYTIINFVAATYLSKGPNPVIEYKKFQKICDFAVARVKEAAGGTEKGEGASKTNAEGGMKGGETEGSGLPRAKSVRKPTFCLPAAD